MVRQLHSGRRKGLRGLGGILATIGFGERAAATMVCGEPCFFMGILIGPAPGLEPGASAWSKGFSYA